MLYKEQLEGSYIRIPVAMHLLNSALNLGADLILCKGDLSLNLFMALQSFVLTRWNGNAVHKRELAQTEEFNFDFTTENQGNFRHMALI